MLCNHAQKKNPLKMEINSNLEFLEFQFRPKLEFQFE